MTTTGQADGDCVVTRWFDPEQMRDCLRVDKADPRVRITAELLDELAKGYGAPEVELINDVLTIRATNRTVIYRIDLDDYDFASCTYGAEWPD